MFIRYVLYVRSTYFIYVYKYIYIIIDVRRSEAIRTRNKYPDRIPIIVEKAPTSPVPDIDKQKFLVPTDLTVAQFIYIIRTRIRLAPEQALFIYVNNAIPSIGMYAQPVFMCVCNVCLCYVWCIAQFMSQLYSTDKSDDGFLYIVYGGESTFGL